jgi:hypothetical protein
LVKTLRKIIFSEVERMNKGLKILRIGIIIMIVISCLTVLTNVFTEDAEAAVQGMPTVSIKLTETSKAANVGPGEIGVVTFTGEVQVTKNQATRVVVSLAAEDTWGSAVVSPSSLLFASDGTQPFGVSVRASPRESFSTQGKVTVTGRWSMYPGGLSGPANPQAGAEGRIDINQFFKFTLRATSKAFQETAPGAPVTFSLTIQNRGNFMDTFTVSITNYERLSKKHFEVTASQYNIEILENPAEEPVRIQVNTPLDWTLYRVEHTSILVEVQSDKGVQEGIPPQTFAFVIREKGFYIPGFDGAIMVFAMVFLLMFISYGYKTYGRPRR